MSCSSTRSRTYLLWGRSSVGIRYGEVGRGVKGLGHERGGEVEEPDEDS
jgi:hypothetical protein